MNNLYKEKRILCLSGSAVMRKRVKTRTAETKIIKIKITKAKKIKLCFLVMFFVVLLSAGINISKTNMTRKGGGSRLYNESEAAFASYIPESEINPEQSNQIIRTEEERDEKVNSDNINNPENSNIREISLNLDKPGVNFNNDSKYKINTGDIEAMLSKKPNILSNNGNTTILILHTHATESYGVTEIGVENSFDNSKNVVAVGERLAQILRSYNLNVIHDKTHHNGEAFVGSYTRSLATIEKHKKENPGINVIIDIHRDSIEYGEYMYSPSIIVGDRKAAQIMLVVGTDGGGLKHPGWKENLSFAVHLQSVLQTQYPGLARCINLRNERFNQHMSAGSILIEMGAGANLLDEALYSAELLGNVIGRKFN